MWIEPDGRGYQACDEVLVPRGSKFETLPGRAIIRQFGWSENEAARKCLADVARVKAAS